MAALFFQYSNSGIFKNSVGPGGKIVNCDLFDGIINESGVSILTSMSVQHSETVQFFQSFGDLVHYFYFGRGVGQIHFDLMCFLKCQSDQAPGIQKLWSSIGSKRGQKVTVSFNSISVTGILTGFNITAVAEPETHYLVSIDLGMIDSSLKKSSVTGSC
jgi:hypothetical protein